MTFISRFHVHINNKKCVAGVEKQKASDEHKQGFTNEKSEKSLKNKLLPPFVLITRL
jgi:hypothetical protein